MLVRIDRALLPGASPGHLAAWLASFAVAWWVLVWILPRILKIFEKKRGQGHIEIEYYSPDDLDRIYGMITGGSQ